MYLIKGEWGAMGGGEPPNKCALPTVLRAMGAVRGGGEGGGAQLGAHAWLWHRCCPARVSLTSITAAISSRDASPLYYSCPPPPPSSRPPPSNTPFPFTAPLILHRGGGNSDPSPPPPQKKPRYGDPCTLHPFASSSQPPHAQDPLPLPKKHPQSPPHPLSFNAPPPAPIGPPPAPIGPHRTPQHP